MRTFGQRPTLALSLVAVTTVVAGCSGGDKPSTQKAATALPTAVVRSASPAPTRPPASPAAKEIATVPTSGHFCQVVKAGVADATKVFPKNMNDPAAYASYGQYVRGMNARMNATAPAEIRGDIRMATKVSNAIVDSYNGKTITIPPAVRAQIQSPEYLAAAKRLGAYSKSHCGVDASSLAHG